jgi:hypothetical protein
MTDYGVRLNASEITSEGCATLTRAQIPVLMAPRRIARSVSMVADCAVRRKCMHAALEPQSSRVRVLQDLDSIPRW